MCERERDRETKSRKMKFDNFGASFGTGKTLVLSFSSNARIRAQEEGKGVLLKGEVTQRGL